MHYWRVTLKLNQKEKIIYVTGNSASEAIENIDLPSRGLTGFKLKSLAHIGKQLPAINNRKDSNS